MDLLKEMRQLAKDDKLEFLTVKKAKQLKGKRIQTIYFGYRGQDGVDDFIIGDIISEYDLAKKDTSIHNISNLKHFNNRAEYWESYMSKEELTCKKRTMLLLTNENKTTHIVSHYIVPLEKQQDFTCSDIDRFVQFRCVEDEN